MNNPSAKAKIITILENRGALVVGSIAWASKLTSHDAQIALDDLVDEGYVERHSDGHRYQLADSGPVGPEAA